jgi:hypothetical protein
VAIKSQPNFVERERRYSCFLKVPQQTVIPGGRYRAIGRKLEANSSLCWGHLRKSATRSPGSPTSGPTPAAYSDNSSNWENANSTGVPNKYYRGAQQVLHGTCLPRKCRTPAKDTKYVSRTTVEHRSADYRGAQQGLPGSLTRITGVPNKDYRGAQQGLPGSLTRITGVPDKDYRGAQQGLPGCPTRITGVPDKPDLRTPCKTRIFSSYRGASCIVLSTCLLCFDNREKYSSRETASYG